MRITRILQVTVVKTQVTDDSLHAHVAAATIVVFVVVFVISVLVEFDCADGSHVLLCPSEDEEIAF